MSCTPRFKGRYSPGGIPNGARGPKTSQLNGSGRVARILDGTGVSADDVLSEAFLGLLEYPPERIESTWEALAVKIAEYKAIDALRASEKGLRGTDHRPELQLVSGDLEWEGQTVRPNHRSTKDYLVTGATGGRVP